MADESEQYCICRRPYEHEQFMIQCDACEDWFHGSCVGIEEHTASDIERYHCPSCSDIYGPLTLKKRRNWHRHDYSELDDGSKAIQTGTVLFINSLKTRKYANAKEACINIHGRELTLEYFEKNGFSKPLMVEKKDGLGIVVPKPGFNIIDVERQVGSMREIDVIDVCKQEDIKMKMREWTEYYMNPVRKKTLNVISLEFSNTPMSALVHVPAIVREMDWANHVWPTDLPDDSPHKKPYVQKYCLMSVKNCYTDFHVDFGGTSVWYHVFKGEKIFYFVEPTPANLEKYHEWVMSSTQSEIYFGDMVKKCYQFRVKQGQTLFIPTGWIHAVFTPVDSLVFGGNFLHSYNIGLQLDIYDLELKLKTPNKFQHPFYETINWFAAVYLLDKLKGIQESGIRPLQYMIKGMQDLANTLKKWTTKGDAFVKHHKFYIPEGVQANKLIRSMNKEIKKAEKSRPLTPKVEDVITQQPSPKASSLTIDSTKTKLKIKTKKQETKLARKDQNSNEESGYSCQVDETNPVTIKIANTQRDSLVPGDSLGGWQGDSLAMSMPSLKLKIPIRQDSIEKSRMSASADTGLKLKVSNGKIVSNASQSSRSVSGREFQSLTGSSDMSKGGEGLYSCTPTQQEPLKLKLSMNTPSFGAGYASPQTLPYLPNDSDLDLSDDELAFSLGGTPQLMSTQGSLGTPHGLQATELDTRQPQPVAGMDTSTSTDRDFKAEIEAAKTLLFGFSSLSESDVRNLTGQTTRSKPGLLNSKGPQKSKLNSKRPYTSDSDDDDGDDDDEKDEDLGFGDSDYFKDTKYAYPPLSEMVDDEKTNWKPGMKKKKSEKVDATWNPKSKVLCSPSKDSRPHRQSARRPPITPQQDAQPSLLNAPLPSSSTSISPTSFTPGPSGSSHFSSLHDTSLHDSTPAAAAAAGLSTPLSSTPSTSSGSAAGGQPVPGKRGRHKTVTTTKQRLAKILKLDKSGRFHR